MSEGNGDQKWVFLGMPGHGAVEFGAAFAMMRSHRGGVRASALYRQGSLLNANCNFLWTWALNAQRSGRAPVDYFALLHSDVCPPDGWLEDLIAELERTSLDVLSVAVPIKDGRGLTSCAIGHPGPQDYWRAFCRVTLAELHQLPETFTTADLGMPERPLLVNTGCFVCRFDYRWAEQVVFQDHNRIVWDAANQKYRAESFPEDWHFSRQCVQLGLRVGCTRKIAVDHVGPNRYGNDHPWGSSEFDREYLDAPALVPVAEEVPA